MHGLLSLLDVSYLDQSAACSQEEEIEGGRKFRRHKEAGTKEKSGRGQDGHAGINTPKSRRQ